MTIQFIPLNAPFSSSFALTASYTDFSSDIPGTASLSGYALNAFGDTGSTYLIRSASYDPFSPTLGLIIS